MEARVDIAKLQLLNDRINQTIDALNQVRMSVHGLQPQSAPPPNTAAWSGLSHSPQMSSTQAYAQQLLAPQAFSPVSPWLQAQLGWQSPLTQSPLGYGLSHSGVDPYTAARLQQLATSAVDPVTLSRMQAISSAADPFLLARVQQTFPFVQQEITASRPLF